MIEETGQVVAVRGDNVCVRAASRAGCQRCAEGRGCGGGIIAMLLADRLTTVSARCGHLVLNVGDRVAVAVPGRVLVAAAAVVYLLPLAGLLAALAVAALWWPAAGQHVYLAAAALGFLAGVLVARRVAGRRRAGGWQPRVTRRLDDCSEFP